MGQIKGLMRTSWQASLALLAIALAPVAVEAAGIGYKNTAPYPIYVQGSVVEKGQVKRGPLLYIKPGQTAWDVNLMKGNMTITVYNTANQVLFQEMRAFPGKDQFYEVIHQAPMARGQPPRVMFREIPLPKR